MSDSCVFCRIAAKEVPAKIVHEDASYVAFHDIRPKAKTHILIIPKRHLPTVNDMKDLADVELIGGMFLLAKELAGKMGIPGYKLNLNVGPEGGQEVMHVHLHLMAD